MPDQDEEDVVHYAGSNPAANPYTQVAPPPAAVQGTNNEVNVNAPVALPGQVPMSSDAVIGQATAQLNAGQPVTALPRQSWSLAEAQAFNARLDAFDQQARAARAARDASARDAQMLDQMMRVAKSTKDVEVAMQQQDVIGFRNAVASGTPALDALQRFPRAATSPLVAAIHAAQPVAAPHIVTDQGEKAWVSGAGHVTRIPGPEPNMPAPTPITLPDGTKVLQVSPQHYQVVQKTPTPGSLNDMQKANLRAIDQEAHEKRVALDRLRPTSQEYLDTQLALGELDIKRKRLLNEASGARPATRPAPAQAVAPTPAAAAPAAAPPARIRLRRKSDGQVFTYPGAAADVPLDRYEVLP